MGSYRTTRKLVSDETDARIGRCGCSCLPTRAAKGDLGARRDGHKFCRDGHETDKGHLEYRKDHRRATLRPSAYSVRAAEDCALPSAGSALPSGCYAAAIHLVVKSYGENRKKMRELVPPTAALGNEKKRVDIAGWLCLHAFMIDHADGGMLFTSLLHPSRCKPTCSTRLHERSRHQRR